MQEKKIQDLFAIRGVLWVIAASATFIWIGYSFMLYDMGIYDVYDYAKHFRPVFYTCLLISIGAISLSLYLRSKSDKLKGKKKHSEE